MSYTWHIEFIYVCGIIVVRVQRTRLCVLTVYVCCYRRRQPSIYMNGMSVCLCRRR